MKKENFVRCTLALSITAACLNQAQAAIPLETTSPFAAMPLELQGAQFIPPNVMLFLDTSGSMCALPNDPSARQVCKTSGNRINVAARVTKNLFNNNKNVRWGLFTFDNRRYANNTVPSDSTFGAIYSVAGLLRTPIDDYSTTHLSTLTTATNDVLNDVDIMGRGTNTPLAEAYIEMVHYFAGLTSAYNKLPNTSPYGTPNSTLRYTSPIQYRCQKNFIIAVTDGDPTQDNQFAATDPILGSLSGLSSGGTTTNFPALTEKAYKGDMLKGLPGQPTMDDDNKSFDDPDFVRQSITTYTVGFAISSQMLKTAASKGGGQYFEADSEASLNEAFQKAIQDIVAKTSSNPAPVSISQPSSGLIQVGFNTENWTGKVTSRAVTNGNISATVSEATVPAIGKRLVFTRYGADIRQSFKKVDPGNSDMQADKSTFGAQSEWTLRFLTGEEPGNDTSWRKRSGKLLGDFINTEPVSLNQGKVFIAGANDGLLHYFTRDNTSSTLNELFAYAPSATLSKVQYVARRDYGQNINPHRYLVDGAIVTQKLTGPMGGDMNLLVGALGRGGKGLYALNLDKADTTPDTDIGLWDVNAEDALMQYAGARMGYTFGRPVIARIKQPATPAGSEPWAVIAGNGYDSGKSLLYFLHAKTAQPLGVVPVGADGPNAGIGGIAVVDTDSDDIADVVYAGDRNGDLWRIDLGAELHNGTQTKVHRLWRGSPGQPITMAPVVHRINDREYMVLFGTGSMLQDADKTSKTAQSVYGIRDDLSKTLSYAYDSDRGAGGKLLQQKILSTQTNGDESYRQVSQVPIPTDNSKPGGWYLDLPVGDVSAERVTQPMIVAAGGVFFTTQIPSVKKIDNCTSSNGDGWIMMVSAVTGAGPLKPIIAPAQVDFVQEDNSVKTSPLAGYKNKAMGMPSALTIASFGGDSAQEKNWLSYKTQAGMINNLEGQNYKTEVLQGGLNIIVSGNGNLDGGSNSNMICDKITGLCRIPAIPANNTAQGYRTSWREII